MVGVDPLQVKQVCSITYPTVYQSVDSLDLLYSELLSRRAAVQQSIPTGIWSKNKCNIYFIYFIVFLYILRNF